MRNLLALTPQDVFGKITPPPGSEGFTGTAGEGLSRILTVSIQFIILIGILFMLFYLLIGAFMWVTSGGDEEAIRKAQLQMTHTVWGFLMIFVALTVFGVVTGDALGIVKKNADGGWSIKIPTLNSGAPGAECTVGTTCDSKFCNTIVNPLGEVIGGTCQ